MPRQRKPAEISKIAFCGKIASALVEFGYPNVTAEQVQECLDAWVKEP